MALIVSMAILIFYPVIMKWVYPPQEQRTQEVVSEEALSLYDVQEPAETTSTPTFNSETSVLESVPAPTTLQFKNNIYEIEFSTLGGTITQLRFLGEEGRKDITNTEFFSGAITSPGIFATGFLRDRISLANTTFNLASNNEPNVIQFVYEAPGDYKITKSYFIHDQDPSIELELRIENLSGRAQSYPTTIEYKMNYDSKLRGAGEFFDAVVLTEKVQTANTGKIKKKGFLVSENVAWSGMIKRYFALLVEPDGKIIESKSSANEDTVTTELKMEPVDVGAGGEAVQRFLIFAGPQRHETLKSYDAGFERVLSRGFFGWFKTRLLLTMKFFYRYTHNYGWSIVLLTLLIKVLFAPLTHIGFVNMRKMQAIGPKQKAIQAQHKNDPKKTQQETMALYKRNKVNPMMGCLPMLVQFPILIAMFRLLPESIELHGAPFIFWIHDLSAPDRLFELPFVVPFLGWDALNVLPILMVLSQVWYQKIMPQTSSSPEQAKIMNYMPIFFGFICYNFSAGLTMYWCLQNVFSIFQQGFINRIAVVLHHEDQH